MQTVSDNKQQFEELGALLGDMKSYLHNVEEGCQELGIQFHLNNKSQPLETLTQIMEGLGYYQKLLRSAAVLLAIDFAETLREKTSIESLIDQLSQIFASLVEAAENEDYSLLTDIVEYDVLPAVHISQGILVVVQERYDERAM